MIVGIVSTCFLFELNVRDIRYQEQLESKNDTILNLRVDIANHKNLFKDLTQLTDDNCFEQINRINLHFNRKVSTKRQ